MAQHRLKTCPKPFTALWSGEKTFEIRNNDRGYAVGDRLVLQEFFPDSCMWGRRIVSADVAYILDGGFGLHEGYVCMALTNQLNEYDDTTNDEQME